MPLRALPVVDECADLPSFILGQLLSRPPREEPIPLFDRFLDLAREMFKNLDFAILLGVVGMGPV
jgi:hypothetical protein